MKGKTKKLMMTAIPVCRGRRYPPATHRISLPTPIAWIVGESLGRSVGVLVSRNGTVRLMIDLLRRRGVRASGEGGVPVTDDAAVNVESFPGHDHGRPSRRHGQSAFEVFHSTRLRRSWAWPISTPREVQRAALKARLALAEEGVCLA